MSYLRSTARLFLVPTVNLGLGSRDYQISRNPQQTLVYSNYMHLQYMELYPRSTEPPCKSCLVWRIVKLRYVLYYVVLRITTYWQGIHNITKSTSNQEWYTMDTENYSTTYFRETTYVDQVRLLSNKIEVGKLRSIKGGATKKLYASQSISINVEQWQYIFYYLYNWKFNPHHLFLVNIPVM